MRRTRRGPTLMAAELFPDYFFLAVRDENPAWKEMQADVPEIFRFLTLTVDTLTGEKKVAFLKPEERESVINMILTFPEVINLERFRVGTRVSVKEGPFGGLSGELVELRLPDRAKIEIEIRTRIFPTVIHLSNLTPQDPPPKNEP